MDALKRTVKTSSQAFSSTYPTQTHHVGAYPMHETELFAGACADSSPGNIYSRLNNNSNKRCLVPSTCTDAEHAEYRRSREFYRHLLGYQFYGSDRECLAMSNCPKCSSTLAVETPILDADEDEALS